jgi:hypothetical protein
MEINMSDEAETTSPETRPGLTLTDIATVVQILSICTNRGVWKAQELSTVGQLYDKLVGFLQSAGVNVEENQNEVKDQS